MEELGLTCLAIKTRQLSNQFSSSPRLSRASLFKQAIARASKAKIWTTLHVCNLEFIIPAVAVLRFRSIDCSHQSIEEH
jgi:hypothetical protein